METRHLVDIDETMTNLGDKIDNLRNKFMLTVHLKILFIAGRRWGNRERSSSSPGGKHLFLPLLLFFHKLQYYY